MRQVGVDLLDGVDLHGKWPQGGGGASVSFEHYMSEVPLLDSKCKNSWRQRLAGLRNVTVSLGRPDFMLMNLEFGLGYASARCVGLACATPPAASAGRCISAPG